METSVTLKIRDDIVARALHIAGRSERELEDILAEWIGRYMDDLPIDSFTDEEVLALCESEVNPMLQYELRNLLMRNREYGLNEEDSDRLNDMLYTYRRSIVRKARALEVAAVRGLLKRGRGYDRRRTSSSSY